MVLKKSKKTLAGLAILALALSFLPRPTLAAPAGFDWNVIVYDDQFTDYASMSVGRIQEFLNAKSGILDTFTAGDGRSAAQIIYDAAQTYKISPQAILTTIQKESSMITRSDFGSKGSQYYLDWVVFYGWCDSCSTGSNKGFANQINAATKNFRDSIDQIATNGYTAIGAWGPGRTKSVTCLSSDYSGGRELCTPGTTIQITPFNASTSALYKYTPHPGGNYSFWKIWRDFGFDSHRLYPNGSLLKAQGSNTIYIIENGVKRKFASQAAFLSRYSTGKVITVPADHLLAYDTGRDIVFANYSLLQPKGSPGIYLLVDDIKRPIHGKAAFQKAGYRREEVVKVTWNDLNQYPDGEPITTENIFPSGILMQSKKTGGIFFVKDGERHPIVSKDIMKSQFGKRKAIPTKTTELESYPLGTPVGFKDGELVTSKTGGPVYVISNGEKLPIASAAVFNAYRFNWSNIIKTTDSALAVHPTGRPLQLDAPIVQTASQ